ncbi:hypothetical protein QYF61_003397 [Mycteria americana]|uniref:Uncharacterized protein n=1 Tax=Mycteria americana TaxID=33587 RepID=A0AAN7RXT0_MYCAM|nr:hypothetical protein QYF61_003397 [Mycteria americana]
MPAGIRALREVADVRLAELKALTSFIKGTTWSEGRDMLWLSLRDTSFLLEEGRATKNIQLQSSICACGGSPEVSLHGMSFLVSGGRSGGCRCMEGKTLVFKALDGEQGVRLALLHRTVVAPVSCYNGTTRKMPSQVGGMKAIPLYSPGCQLCLMREVVFEGGKWLITWSRNGDFSENHHFISGDMGMTIPLFFLEVEESLTSVCVSGMGSKGKSICVWSRYLAASAVPVTLVLLPPTFHLDTEFVSLEKGNTGGLSSSWEKASERIVNLPGQILQYLPAVITGCVWISLATKPKEESEQVLAGLVHGPQEWQMLSESQNRIGWKRPLRSSSPTVSLTLPRPPLYHVPKHLIQTAFKYPQGWGLNHCPGQPGPVLDHPFSEVTFPHIQSKPPLLLPGRRDRPHLSTPSFQAVVESDEVSPQPPFLQAEQPQVPQPLPISLVLQTLPQLRCPSLDTLQPLNVSLVVRGPTLNTAFEVRPHQCRVQGHGHCPSPAGHTIPDTSQDAIGLLGRLGTLLAPIQAAVNQHPQVLLCQAPFQPLFPKPVALHGVVVAQVQDPVLSLVDSHTIDLSPLIQPVQVPLQSLPTPQQINTPAQLGVVCKVTEGALNPFIQIIDKDIKQDWPQHRALGTPLPYGKVALLKDGAFQQWKQVLNGVEEHQASKGKSYLFWKETCSTLACLQPNGVSQNGILELGMGDLVASVKPSSCSYGKLRHNKATNTTKCPWPFWHSIVRDVHRHTCTSAVNPTFRSCTEVLIIRRAGLQAESIWATLLDGKVECALQLFGWAFFVSYGRLARLFNRFAIYITSVVLWKGKK